MSDPLHPTSPRVSRPSGDRAVTILGSTVDLLTMPQVVQTLDEWVELRDGRCRRVVVSGFHGLWAASNDPTLQAQLNSADLWVPDGIAPVWVARRRGHRDVERIAGADLMRAAFELGRERRYRHYFYGDRGEVLDALRTRIESEWPGNVVAGTYSPPFRTPTSDELDEHVAKINASGADFLWVGLGMPKQDRWIYDLQESLAVPVAVGVGAAFSFIAGTVRRAPDWMGRAGFEWLFRLAQEPRKCWRRCFVEGPQFVFRVLAEERRARS